MYSEPYIVALDPGNAWIKVKVGDREIDIYENIYSFRDDQYLTEFYLCLTRIPNKFNIDRMMDVSVKNGSSNRIHNFIFGKQALDLHINSNERGNSSKSNDMELVNHSIACIANSILKVMDEDKWTENVKVDIILSAGLPYWEFIIAGRKEEYMSMFKGEHTINFLHPCYPVKEMKINIINTTVISEGDMALRQVLYEKKDLNDTENKIFYIIDLGFYNINVIGAHFDENLDFTVIPELSYSLKEGLGIAIELTRQDLKTAYSKKLGPFGEITRAEVIEAAKENYYERKISGSDINIEPFYQKNCYFIAKRISKNIKSYFKDIHKNNYNISEIYIVGGGSYDSLIRDSIKEGLKEININSDLIKFVDDAEYKNIQGYFTQKIIKLEDENSIKISKEKKDKN